MIANLLTVRLDKYFIVLRNVLKLENELNVTVIIHI